MVTIEHIIDSCIECPNRRLYVSAGVYKSTKLICGITGTTIGDQYEDTIPNDCPLEIAK